MEDAKIDLQEQPQGEPHDEPVVLARPLPDQVGNVARQVHPLQDRAHLLPGCLEPPSLILKVAQHCFRLLPYIPSPVCAHY